jgi:hypothetical protein
MRPGVQAEERRPGCPMEKRRPGDLKNDKRTGGPVVRDNRRSSGLLE